MRIKEQETRLTLHEHDDDEEEEEEEVEEEEEEKLFFISYFRSQWPRGLRRRSTAARLLGLWFRIPPGAWMFVC